MGSDLLSRYMKENSYSILEIRGESINIPSLLLALLKPKFWSGRAMSVYIDQYISFVRPEILITYIDNDIRFYTLSKKFPSVKTIFIQNGRRSELGDIFDLISPNSDYHVDYMFVFGEAIADKYSEYLTGLTIPIGSFKNNLIAKKADLVVNSVIFISSWGNKSQNSAFMTRESGKSIEWTEYFAVEKRVLDFLDRWCSSNNKILKICGRSIDLASDERDYYSAHLTKSEWEFLPRIDSEGIYHHIDSAELVTFIDSTSGLESLGRGKRTVAFSCRANVLDAPSESFGWPGELPPHGPFWTSELDDIEFDRIMDFATSSREEFWVDESNLYKRLLMQFDPNNSRFQSVLNSILEIRET